MTREEVAEIVLYCKEHKMFYKERLEELGIPRWKFYDSKAVYAKEQRESGSSVGEFLQLVPGGAFEQIPSLAATTGRKSNAQKAELSARMLSIEMRTPAGMALRIQGEMTPALLQSILQTASGHV